jgi:hypothetical protein
MSTTAPNRELGAADAVAGGVVDVAVGVGVPSSAAPLDVGKKDVDWYSGRAKAGTADGSEVAWAGIMDGLNSAGGTGGVVWLGKLTWGFSKDVRGVNTLASECMARGV